MNLCNEKATHMQTAVILENLAYNPKAGECMQIRDK